MTTSRLGNVYVLDAKTSEMLDIIAGVRPYAHLEYGSGFMIFDTHCKLVFHRGFCTTLL